MYSVFVELLLKIFAIMFNFSRTLINMLLTWAYHLTL